MKSTVGQVINYKKFTLSSLKEKKYRYIMYRFNVKKVLLMLPYRSILTGCKNIINYFCKLIVNVIHILAGTSTYLRYLFYFKFERRKQK